MHRAPLGIIDYYRKIQDPRKIESNFHFFVSIVCLLEEGSRKVKAFLYKTMMQKVTILLIGLVLIFFAMHSSAKYILVDIDDRIAAKNAKVSGMYISF